jgi:hypothetical protein
MAAVGTASHQPTAGRWGFMQGARHAWVFWRASPDRLDDTRRASIDAQAFVFRRVRVLVLASA